MVIPRSRSALSLSRTHAYLKEPLPSSAASYTAIQISFMFFPSESNDDIVVSTARDTQRKPRQLAGYGAPPKSKIRPRENFRVTVRGNGRQAAGNPIMFIAKQ